MISPETIALVRERTDIASYIGETVRLTRKGRSLSGLCPFHKEKTPSFTVNADRGFFHCFGCKESGSAIDFAMKLHGLTFPEAVRELAERAGIAIEENQSTSEQREATAARRVKDDLYTVNHVAALYFERCLFESPLAHHARAELGRRGLDAGALRSDPTGDVAVALGAFRVGYAPHSWDGLATYLREQGLSLSLAERVGLLGARSSGSGYYDRFRHRLMFAVVDVMGRVVAFSGRALPDPTPAELPRGAPTPDPDNKPAKYINSPESPIYTKGEHLFGLYQARQAIRGEGSAVLVEGNFDVVSLHARGVANVIAPLGTAFTDAQAKLLKRYAPTAVLLFDGDSAGKKAVRTARASCKVGGLEAKVATLPAGADPDDWVREHGAEAMRRLIAGARGMLEYLIDDALASDAFGGVTLSEQLARIRAVATLLSEENDPSLRAMAKHYADRLSSQLIIAGKSPTDLRQLEQIIDGALRRPAALDDPERPAPFVSRERLRSPARIADISLAIIGAILDFPELLDDPDIDVALATLEGDSALTVAALRRGVAHQEDICSPSFLARLPDAIHSFAMGRLASPAFDAQTEAKSELMDNARKLDRLTMQRENEAAVRMLQHATATGDPASEDELLREIQARSRRKLGLE